MKLHRKVLPAVAVTLFVLASPLGAFTLIEMVPMQQRVRVAQGASFRTQVQLAQAAMGDGSVKLQPGMYNVDIFSMGDGSVRVTFFDMTGRKAGEAHGIIAVLRTENTVHPATTNQAKKGAAKSTAPATGAVAAPVTFQSLGFVPTSRASFSQLGGKMNLEIGSTDGGHSILIGLLLPAVQVPTVQTPAGNKVKH